MSVSVGFYLQREWWLVGKRGTFARLVRQAVHAMATLDGLTAS